MQHMSARGEKTVTDSGKNEGDVLRFLNNGVSLANLPAVFKQLNEKGPVMRPMDDSQGSGNKFLDRYLKMRSILLGEFPKGYKITRTDSPEFELYAALDGGRHVEFGQIHTAGLGEAMSGDRGASLA